MKRIHTIAVIILLSYIGLVALNIPPLVKSNNVSVNWNMLVISGLGIFLGGIYITVFLMLRNRENIKTIHLGVILSESVVFTLEIINCRCRLPERRLRAWA
jgi:hypothetical protein